MDDLIVRPLVGAGKVRLGMTPDEAFSTLGRPSRIRVDEDNPEDEYWDYDLPHRIRLEFGKEEDGRVTSIDLYAPDTRLWAIYPLGMHRNECIAALEKAGPGEWCLDEDLTEIEIWCHENDETGLMLWSYQDGIVDQLSILCHYDALDSIVFPDSDGELPGLP